MGGVMDVLEQNTFVKLTVRKLLFGYSNPLLKLGADVLPPEKRWPHKLFGLFVGVSFISNIIIRSRVIFVIFENPQVSQKLWNF